MASSLPQEMQMAVICTELKPWTGSICRPCGLPLGEGCSQHEPGTVVVLPTIAFGYAGTEITHGAEVSY